MTTKLTTIATALLMCGCSWVSPEPGAGTVAVSTTEQLSHCQRLGSASAKSLNKVGFISRDGDKLQSELKMLARNEALGMGGNAIAPESAIVRGQQKFGVYRCP